MPPTVVDQAEEVAERRWLATETRAGRRARQAAALVEEVEALLARRWAETEAMPAADAADAIVASPWWAPTDSPTTYRLFDRHGQPIRCHLCGRDDRWTPEGDVEHQVIHMFACEHEPLRIGHGLVRQVSTVALNRVMRCEAAV
jgi:hypothetical protein